MTAETKASTISIIGGDRTVSKSGFTMAVTVVDPAGPADYTAVAWSCTEQCPSPLDQVTKGKKFTVADVPAGKYTLNATYKGATSQAVITVQEGATLGVQVLAPTDEHLTTESLRVVAAVDAGTATETITVQWKSGDSVIPLATRTTLLLTPDLISKYAKEGTLSLTCVATAGTLSGSSTATIKLLSPISAGTCTIVHADSQTTGGFVAGESTVSIKTSGWGESASKIMFNYGFLAASRKTGALTVFMPLTTMPQVEESLRTTCPLVRTSKAHFMVVAVIGGRSIANTSCNVDVSYPTDLTAVAKTQVDTMKQAADADDAGAMLEAARIAASALDDTTSGAVSGKEKGTIRSQVLAAVRQTFANASSPSTGSSMTREERASTVQLLNSVCGGGDNSTILGASDKENVKELMTRLLDTSGDAGASELDTKTQTTDLLNIISSLKGDNDAIKSNTQNLAKAAARNLEPGEKQQDKNNDFALMAEKRPAADATSSPMVSESTSVKLNEGVLSRIAGLESSSEISLSTVEYSVSPVGLEGNKVGAEFASLATEIDLQANGIDTSVSGLSDPILIRMKVKREMAEKGITCRYYNTTSKLWTNEGCVDGGFDLDTYEKLCYVYHLSMFAVVTGGSADAGAAVAEDTPPGEVSVGLIVGICVAVVLLIGVAVGFIVTRGKTNQQRTTVEEGDKNAVPLLQLDNSNSPSRPAENV